MTIPERRSESFVVRIWLERREIAGALPQWRGSIEHVDSGKRAYLLDLDSVVIFMAEYVTLWGIKPKSWILVRERIRKLGLHNLLKRNGDTK